MLAPHSVSRAERGEGKRNRGTARLWNCPQEHLKRNCSHAQRRFSTDSYCPTEYDAAEAGHRRLAKRRACGCIQRKESLFRIALVFETVT